MNALEFSQAFDALSNAYSIKNNYGESETVLTFSEYEKSLFLTKAQEELILTYYNGKNTYNESFELTEEIRRYLSSLVKTNTLQEYDSDLVKLHNNSHFFKLDEDQKVWFITYETLELEESNCNKTIEVVPATQDELNRILKNPFRGPTSGRALRLDLQDNIVEIIYPTTQPLTYKVRFLTSPTPIITDTLPEDCLINGMNGPKDCNLHEALHHAILNVAVRLAIETKAAQSNKSK